MPSVILAGVRTSCVARCAGMRGDGLSARGPFSLGDDLVYDWNVVRNPRSGGKR